MPEFLSPTDIGNRALQHCGADQMDATLGFTEQTERARQVSFAYGKLRRAEQRRNVWTFATRKAPLRPIDSNTLILVPTLWSSSVTYFPGSIVADASGTLWISRIRNNLNNQPQAVQSAWEPYFGPMTVMIYDSSQTYVAGELVYTAAGDGTFNVFQSALSGNNVHPALPNQWSIDTIYMQNQVVQTFPAWASGTTYGAGASVSFTDGNIYSSLAAGNVGNTPSLTSTKWALMPVLTIASALVPTTTFQTPIPPTSTPIDEWQQETTYNLGSFVIFNAAVYVSTAVNNTGNFPNASGSWALCTGGTLSMSLIDLNIGNNPASAPVLWAVGTTYAIGNKVGASDGLIYTSLTNGNIGHNPASNADPTDWSQGGNNPWTTVFTQGGGNSMWLQIGGAAFPNGVGITPINIKWPLNSGPVSQSGTRNAYRLPAGYLRLAPQDPKAGSVSWLGAPSGLVYKDWEFDKDFIVTRDVDLIIFRFVADAQDVTQFDDMFCEGLACRIALEISPRLTQSIANTGVLAKMYGQFMTEARTQNFIEQGAEEQPEDDWVACRQ